jgi:hypothetical protein
MKLITMLLLCVSLCKNCSSQSQNDLKKASVEYSASTRGFYMKISIKDQMLSVSKDRNASNPATETKISDADWQELIELFSNIDLKSISTLKSPTEKRFYDGAAIGNLKINYKDKEYESSAFDHGFPPEEIKKFVDKINSFVKKE